MNEKGYRNLLKLGSLSWAQDKLAGWSYSRKDKKHEFGEVNRVVTKWGESKPRITFQELLDNHEGLILGSGCLIGSLNKAFLNGEFTQAEKNLMKLLEVYKGRLFAEILPHNCFVAGTKVRMADATLKPIEDICVGDTVMSYNEKTGNIVTSIVTRTYKTPSKESDFCSHYSYGTGTQPQKTPVISTKDHLFFDGNGWVKVDNSKIACRPGWKPSKEQEEEIVGMMLGDASIDRNGKFSYSQETRRKGRVEQLLSWITWGNIEIKERKGKGVTHRFFVSDSYFMSIRDKWYPDGKKRVPRDLEITPRTLASWFMDDGTATNRQAIFCTQGFIEEDIDFIVKKMMEIGFSPVKSRTFGKSTFFIRLNKDDHHKLCEMVSKYTHPECKYKIKEEFRSIKYVPAQISKEMTVYPTVSLLRVPNPYRIKKDPIIDYSFKYDIEVENTHCFFVGQDDLLVHNCTHDYNRDTKQFQHNECSDFSPDGDLQKSCNIKMIEVAKKHNLPLLMTIDSHFVKPSQKKLQDVLLQNGDPSGWHFKNSYHMMTTEEAWSHWEKAYGGDIEQQKIFTEAVENNTLLTELAKDLSIQDSYHLPTPTIPKEVLELNLSESDQRKATILRAVNQHGRMKWGDPVWEERLERELSVICDNGSIDFSPYFLFLEQWNTWTREHSVLSAPGRGSGAGSLLCYLLGITHLDPIKHNLPFERFLSQARINRLKYPDIDWDLSDRDPLLAKLEESYGDKFAQCSTHHTLKVKNAIKDACRVILGWNSQDKRVDGICKTIPNTPQGVNDKDFLLGYKDAEGNLHDGHLMQNQVLADFFLQNKSVYEMVLQLLGIPRAVSRHASAYLISDRPIYESVPTCDIGGHLCTQYTATANNNMVEKAGLIKFDFLRVNTLSDISGCVRLIQKKMGYEVRAEKQIINGEEFKLVQGELPITKIPLCHKNDGQMIVDIYELPETEEVFKDFDDGKTESIFQVSSALMTGFAKRIRPRSVQELSDIVALVRPGPLEALLEDGKTTMTEGYIARKNGKMKVSYVHPDMEPIVKNTYGVFVYQEQLSRAFVELAGYSQEEADELREILAKKKKQELEKRIPDLRKRLEAKGWTSAQSDSFVSLCVASSAYSFNLSHSASYALVAYQCAFLKHYFPTEWWTSVLNNAKVEDIKEKGFAKAVKEILIPPSVNGPTATFELDSEVVRSPLYLIDKIGDSACLAIQRAREAGPYTSFQDFFERVDKKTINQGIFHQLILAGAFDEIEPNKTFKELIEEYHTLKRVTSLKVGRDKLGEALKQAVVEHKTKHPDEKVDVPELHWDEVEIEIERVKSLPIYRMDVHDNFRRFLSTRFLYGSDGLTTMRVAGGTTNVLKNAADIKASYAHSPKATVAYVGLINDMDEFRYNDRKSGKQVTALKVNLANDGDSIECVMWPDTYEILGKPKANRIILVTGQLKPSREPGKWSIFVQNLEHL